MSLPTLLRAARTSMLLSSLLLAACGGGSSGSGGGTTLFSGAVIDAPIPNAAITITANAPLGQPGAVTLATTTADANANWSVNVSLPATAEPIYVNATSPTNASVLLSSFLGSSTTLSQLGTVSSSNVPNAVVSQVTTAALALAKAEGQDLGTLSTTEYNNVLNGNQNQLVTLAAGIQAVTDEHCGLPHGMKDTRDMAEQIAAQALSNSGTTSSSTSTPSTTPTTSSVLSQTTTTLGSSCQATLQALMQSIPASATWALQFQSNPVGPVNVSPAVTLTGSYQIQGYLVDTGMNSQGTANTTPTPAPLLINNTIAINSTGSISSSDGTITGTVSGALLNLTIQSSNTTYSLGSGLRNLGSSLLQTGSAAVWSAMGGGTAAIAGTTTQGTSTTPVTTTQDAVRFDLVLTPAASQPNWSGLVSGSSSISSGPSSICPSTASPIEVMASGQYLGGLHAPLCLSSSATGLSFSAPTITAGNPVQDFLDLALQNVMLPTLTMTENSATTPFILVGTPTTLSINKVTYTLSSYYVLGSNEVIYNLNAPATTSQAAISVNGSLVLDGAAFLGINLNTASTGNSVVSGSSSTITLSGLAGGIGLTGER